MRTRVSYPAEVKEEAVRLRLAGVPVAEVMKHLDIKNKTQVKTWVRWYRNGETHRFQQPVGKQYTFGKGPDHFNEVEKLKAENHYLKQHIEVLTKYKELERKWFQE